MELQCELSLITGRGIPHHSKKISACKSRALFVSVGQHPTTLIALLPQPSFRSQDRVTLREEIEHGCIPHALGFMPKRAFWKCANHVDFHQRRVERMPHRIMESVVTPHRVALGHVSGSKCSDVECCR